MAANRCEWARADGHALPAQEEANDAGGRLQQFGSGHVEVARAVVSLPRNHFTCWYGTPMLSENSPAAERSVRAVHQ
jgi:hypothetical protein